MIVGILLAIQATLVVSPTGPYRTVAAAVDAARAGDTVRVRAGVYAEPEIRIGTPLTLMGEPGAVLDGQGRHGILVVAAPRVTIRGLLLRRTGSSYVDDRAAIRVEEASDCAILDNRLEDTFFAIYLQRTSGCTVAGNVILGRPGREVVTGNGIHSWGSERLVVRDNRIAGHRDGIYFEFTRHAEVDGNVCQGNRRYGLHFMFSDSSTYRDNTFAANGTGVAVMYSHLVTLVRNRFRDSRGPTAYGLLLKDLVDSRIEENVFSRNTTALVADGADRAVVGRNRFVGNGTAVRLLGSTRTARFVDNDFTGNAFDVVVNARGTSATFAGNWWASYVGWDLDRDGTGDVPHHPVRLFSLLVARSEPALMLQRSLFVRLLDAAERALPVLTPQAVVAPRPRMRPVDGEAT